MWEYRAKLDRVVDGDTVDANIDLGFHVNLKERLRLAGIDCPDIYCVKKGTPEYERGLKAKKYVEKRLAENNNQMIIKTDKLGKWGRWIAEIYLSDSEKSLNRELIEVGLASALSAGKKEDALLSK